MAAANILVLDPLTLMGKELLASRERLDALAGSVEFRHTAEDDEHQIAEFGGEPALVPPLTSEDNLEDFEAIVVTSDLYMPRHELLLAHLDNHPDAAFVDTTRMASLRDRSLPSLGAPGAESRQLRVAHPALVATSAVVEVLTHLGRLAGSLAAVDPVSEKGREAIECLAQQARQRGQGAAVKELIDDHVLAFNLVAVESDELQEDATRLLPDIPLAVSRSVAGFFHGHLANLGLSFDAPVKLEAVNEALSLATGIERASLPLSLDTIPDHDRVVVTPPSLSSDGRQLALTAMADGLRIGGAITAMDILEMLI